MSCLGRWRRWRQEFLRNRKCFRRRAWSRCAIWFRNWDCRSYSDWERFLQRDSFPHENVDTPIDGLLLLAPCEDLGSGVTIGTDNDAFPIEPQGTNQPFFYGHGSLA